MAPKLYYLPESGPCRTVMMTAKVLGIGLELVYVDLFKGEHLKPEFLKLNPSHSVPTLTDGDLSIGESRCIMMYLAERYGKDDSLYPKDPIQRARVNQMIFFDMGSLYEPVINYYRVIYMGSKDFDQSKWPGIEQGFTLLNTYLANSKFSAGDCLTLADITLISTVSTAIAVFDFDLKPYPNVLRWFNMVKNILPDYKGIIEENARKLRVLVDTTKAKLAAK